jgi:hypothetical protein
LFVIAVNYDIHSWKNIIYQSNEDTAYQQSKKPSVKKYLGNGLNQEVVIHH